MLALRNACIVEFGPPRVESERDVMVDGPLIVDIGQGIASKYSPDDEIDLEGKLLIPGFVCAHHHFYSCLARGILAALKPAPDFVSLLKNLWWRLDQAIDRDILVAGATVAALEAIRSGTTSVIDHHVSPECLSGSLSAVQAAFEQTGLRGILGYEVTDRYGPESAEAAISENRDFARTIAARNRAAEGPGLIEAAIGAHAPFTLSDGTLTRLAEVVSETSRGLHIHVSEDRYDASDSRYRYGTGPVERLERFGLLDKRTICVHGVHLSDSEIALLNDRDSFLVHNPRSNMNNGVGYMDRLKQVKNPALGTDGLGSDMIEEAKFCYFKNRDASGSFTPQTVATILSNGNKILERYFGRPFGKIAVGHVADMVIVDYEAPTPLQVENCAAHLLFGLSSRMVHTVLINGRSVFRDKCFGFDTKPYYEAARKAAAKLWSTMDKRA